MRTVIVIVELAILVLIVGLACRPPEMARGIHLKIVAAGEQP